MSHPAVHGQTPVAPSAIAPGEDIFTTEGMQPIPTPRELDTASIAGVVHEFRLAAHQAKAAGFDGVEVHGANGYLIDQFLQSGSNQRTDEYGGSVAKRTRFLFEVLDAVTDVWGPGRVGLRLSPGGAFGGMSDDDPADTFGYAMKSLNNYDLAYLHVVETSQTLPPVGLDEVGGPTALARSTYDGTIITAGEYGRESADAAVADGRTDLVAFARAFISNPDLPERFRVGADLNEGDEATYYGGGPEATSTTPPSSRPDTPHDQRRPVPHRPPLSSRTPRLLEDASPASRDKERRGDGRRERSAVDRLDVPCAIRDGAKGVRGVTAGRMHWLMGRGNSDVVGRWRAGEVPGLHDRAARQARGVPERLTCGGVTCRCNYLRRNHSVVVADVQDHIEGAPEHRHACVGSLG